MKKKKIWFSLLLGLFSLILVACSSSSTVTETTETATTEEVVSGATEREYTDPSEIKDSYDVIVVGSGGAGMAAAISAKDAGADVAIFEKMPVIGGNTSKSSGGMNASETKFQKEQGIEDSNDLFYEETLKGGKGTNDPELLRYMVDNSADAIDWLDSMGIRLNKITFSGGFSVARIHRPEDGSAVGGYLVNGLYYNLMEREVPIFVNAEVTDLTDTDGAVTGVTVKIDGKEKTIKAKSVVLATGGFGSNMDMITKFKPELEGYVTTNHEGATGDGPVAARRRRGRPQERHAVVQCDRAARLRSAREDGRGVAGDLVRVADARVRPAGHVRRGGRAGRHGVGDRDGERLVMTAVVAVGDPDAHGVGARIERCGVVGAQGVAADVEEAVVGVARSRYQGEGEGITDIGVGGRQRPHGGVGAAGLVHAVVAQGDVGRGGIHHRRIKRGGAWRAAMTVIGSDLNAQIFTRVAGGQGVAGTGGTSNLVQIGAVVVVGPVPLVAVGAAVAIGI